jgi:glycosyltransferase involved in cell wall biosynthesis
MRILLANNYARVTGGADLHCLELAEGLRERGHDVAFIATADEGNVEQNGVFVSTTVTRETRAETRGIKAAQVACYAMWNPSAAAATKELLNSFHADIVHVHKLYPQLSVAPLVVAAKRGVEVVQTVHDYEFISASIIDDTGKWIDRDEERFAYRTLNTLLFGVKRLIHAPRVGRWISVSRSTRDAYREHGIETAVLPNFTKPYTGQIQSFDDRKGVLFIGRLSEEKGLRHVLDLPKHAPGHPILIAGGGPLQDEVERVARAVPSMSYLGKLDRGAIAQQLASVRLVVIPSLWREPGPLAALEAMEAGTPLIAYDNGGLAEYVADASAGLIVPPTVSSLADAVRSLYDDRERWERLSANGRSAVQQNHTRSVYLDRLEQVYVEAMDSGKAGRRRS